MSELIKREDAIKATWHDPSYIDPYNILTEVRDRIEALPTVDAVPVKWIENYIDSLRAIGLIFNAVIIDGLLRDYKKRADGERRSDGES